MGAEAAIGALAFRKVRQKLGLEKKKDSNDAPESAASTDTGKPSVADSAAYDGMLSEDAVMRAKRRKRASDGMMSGTIAGTGDQTFSGGALGA